MLTYYLLVLAPVVATAAIFLSIYAGASNLYPDSFWEWVLYYAKFFWFSGALVACTNLAGLLLYGHPDKRNAEVINRFRRAGWNPGYNLIVVYVSRGDNANALYRSVVATAKLLSKHKVRYRIDIVTDLPVDKHFERLPFYLRLHLVPQEYVTLRGAKWKARALHYALERQDQEPASHTRNTWVLHLDEESQMHISSLAGVYEFITNPANRRKVGQGEIKYNAHRYTEHEHITVIDSFRTGDDLGRFRLQFKLFGRPLFGMHGSFILAPYALERRFGFDLGGKGSVTEDAYFALKCYSQGVKFGWVDGYIREQSPYTIPAILKQRRRWYCGLMMLSFDGSVPLRARWMLMINTLLWTIAWLGPIVSVFAIIFGGYFPLPLILAASLLQGAYASTYVVGAWRNLHDHKLKIGLFKRLELLFAAVVLLPISSAVEGAAVLYGLIRPVKGFEVVAKN